jgi:transcription antitermination factor NusG
MYNENEQWYAMQIIPSFEAKIIKAMNEAALETPAEVQIFNPYYRIHIIKPNIAMKAKRKRKSQSTPVFEGYMFFYLDSSDFNIFSNILSSKLRGIIKILKDPISEIEIEKVYEVVLLLKKKKGEEEVEVVDENVKKIISLDDKDILLKKCVVKNGALVGMGGHIESINKGRKTAKIILSVFGRNTPVELPIEVLEVEL